MPGCWPSNTTVVLGEEDLLKLISTDCFFEIPRKLCKIKYFFNFDLVFKDICFRYNQLFYGDRRGQENKRSRTLAEHKARWPCRVKPGVPKCCHKPGQCHTQDHPLLQPSDKRRASADLPWHPQEFTFFLWTRPNNPSHRLQCQNSTDLSQFWEIVEVSARATEHLLCFYSETFTF